MASTIPTGYEATLDESIIVGDDVTHRHRFNRVPSGQALAQLTWTVKENLSDADSAAVWQKIVTPVEQPNEGQIENNGATTGKSITRFDVTQAQTARCLPGVIYVYDYEAISSAGKKKTIGRGHFIAQSQVTQS